MQLRRNGFHSSLIVGCTCGEGLLPPLLVQFGAAARMADLQTVQMSLSCALRALE